jgi:hypothetical protein
MIARDYPGVLASTPSKISILGTQTSWRFGAIFCRPSAHYSHLSPADSGKLPTKLSRATRTSMWAAKKDIKNFGVKEQFIKDGLCKPWIYFAEPYRSLRRSPGPVG